MRPGNTTENLPLYVLRDIRAETIHHQHFGFLSRVNHRFLNIAQVPDHVERLVGTDYHYSHIGRFPDCVGFGILCSEAGRKAKNEGRRYCCDQRAANARDHD
jgi:hypothetical protein